MLHCADVWHEGWVWVKDRCGGGVSPDISVYGSAQGVAMPDGGMSCSEYQVAGAGLSRLSPVSVPKSRSAQWMAISWVVVEEVLHDTGVEGLRVITEEDAVGSEFFDGGVYVVCCIGVVVDGCNS